MDEDVLLVTTTFDDKALAEQFGVALVERSLAACVQIVGPIKSIYRWKDNVEKQSEWMCVAKTTRARVAKLEETVHEKHPYDLPEFVVTKVEGGSVPYLDWVRESVRGRS